MVTWHLIVQLTLPLPFHQPVEPSIDVSSMLYLLYSIASVLKKFTIQGNFRSGKFHEFWKLYKYL